MTAEINNNRWLSSCWMRPGPGLLASEPSEQPLGWGHFADQLTQYQPGYLSRLCPPRYYLPPMDFQTFLRACCWKNQPKGDHEHEINQAALSLSGSPTRRRRIYQLCRVLLPPPPLYSCCCSSAYFTTVPQLLSSRLSNHATTTLMVINAQMLVCRRQYYCQCVLKSKSFIIALLESN